MHPHGNAAGVHQFALLDFEILRFFLIFFADVCLPISRFYVVYVRYAYVDYGQDYVPV